MPIEYLIGPHARFSAAVGEPPQCMSCSVLFAVKRAIESARADSGVSTLFNLGESFTWQAIRSPYFAMEICVL